MIKRNFWDILAWLVLAYITVWLVLKAMGIINTPTWLEYSPLFGAIYLGGRAMNKLDRAAEDIKEMRKDLHNLDKRVTVIENK